ncbi:MAG: hypothetical protein WCD79_06190 [Chthoniobacteraceae bacterium]
MALIRKLFWAALFVVSTISFVVFFDHGTTDFQKNFKGELSDFTKLVKMELHPPKKDDPDKATK